MDVALAYLPFVGTFIGTCSLLIAAVAVGARWLGRPESDRMLADARRYQLEVLRDPRTIELRANQMIRDAYRSADQYWGEELRKREQLVRRAENEAQSRAKSVQGYGELLRDAKASAARLMPLLDRPQGIRGVLWQAARWAERRAARSLPHGSARRPDQPRSKGRRL